jgi:putative addiction module killer protein
MLHISGGQLPQHDVLLSDRARRKTVQGVAGRLKDIVARQKVRIRLDNVRLGNLGKNRSAGEGVYELKIHYGPGYRVYYGLAKKTVVLLLLGGDKSSQKKDIAHARVHWQDYKRRSSDE